MASPGLQDVLLQVPRVSGVARSLVQFSSDGKKPRSVYALKNISAGTILYDEPVHYLLNERTPSTSDKNYARYTRDVTQEAAEPKGVRPVERENADMQSRSVELTKFLALTVGVHSLIELFQGGFPEDFIRILQMVKKQYKVSASTVKVLNKLLAPYYIHLPGSFSYDEDIKHTVFQKAWISLLDHSCAPNVLMGLYETEVHDRHSLHEKIEYRIRVIALKNISSGDMLVRSYITTENPQLSPLLSRHMLLHKQTWIQMCTCSMCRDTHCTSEELSFIHKERNLCATWIDSVWTRLDANIPIRPYSFLEKYPDDISVQEKDNLEKLFATVRNCTGTEKGIYLRRITIIQWFLFYFTLYGKPALTNVHMENTKQLKTVNIEDSEMWTLETVDHSVEMLDAFASFPSVYKKIPSMNPSGTRIPNLSEQTCTSTFSKPPGFNLWPRVVLRNFSNLLKLLILHDWNEFSDTFVQNLANVTMLLITVLSKTMAGQREQIKEPVIACELALMFALTQLRLKSHDLKQRFQCIEQKIAKERIINNAKAAATAAVLTAVTATATVGAEHTLSASATVQHSESADKDDVDMVHVESVTSASAAASLASSKQQEVANSKDEENGGDNTESAKAEKKKVKSSALMNVFIDDVFLEQYVQPVVARLCITVDLMRFFYESIKIVHPSLESHLNSMFVRHAGDMVSTQLKIPDGQALHSSAAAASADKSTGCSD